MGCRLLVLWLMLVGAACSNPRVTPGHAVASAPPDPPLVLPPSPELLRAKLELSDRVGALAKPSEVPASDAVLGAMHAMADMVQALPKMTPEMGAAALSMRSAAEELESLPPGAPLTGDVTRAALEHMVIALDAEGFERPGASLANEIGRARLATQAIVPTTPVKEQAPVLQRAFCAVSDAVLSASANGTEVRTCVAPTSRLAQDETLQPVIDDLRSALHDIASGALDPSRLAAARVFEQLAVGFQRSGSINANLGWSIASLRAQADAVRRDIEYEEQSVADVVTGLRSALLGLDAVAAREHAGSKSVDWLTSARLAVDTIELSGTYVNQRALVQDAFRAVVDAFAVLTQLISRCE